MSNKEIFLQAIILNVHYTGANMALLTIFSESEGLKKGIVKIAKKRQAELQKGNVIEYIHLKKQEDNLGTIKFNLIDQTFIRFFDNLKAIKALNQIIKLLNIYLKQDIPYKDVFELTKNQIKLLEDNHSDLMLALYEFNLLKELGFTIDTKDYIKENAKDKSQAYYVSPKSARVVSEKLGSPYKDKLIILPQCLGGVESNQQDELVNKINKLLINKMHQQ